MSTSPDAKELKKRLAAAGFEIFRVAGSRVHLADRVRDNLILDSGVSVVAEPLAIRLVTRAPGGLHPAGAEAKLFGQARERAEAALARGYREVETCVVPVPDPGGGGATLETWYEVAFEKPLSSENELRGELEFALGLEKAAGPS